MKKFAAQIAIAALVLLACLPGDLRATPPGIEHPEWRGTGTILATMGDWEVTDTELYLFAVLTQAVAPTIVTRWEEGEPTTMDLLRANIDTYFQILSASEYIQQQGGIEGADDDLASRVIRLTASPIAQLIWADKVVRESVRLFPEDILHRYLLETAQDSADDLAYIKRLVITHPVDAGLEVRNEAAARARQLREQAIAAGGLSPILEADPSLRPEGVTGVEVLRRRDERFDSQVRAEAFRLGISQVSNIIRTPTGVVLVELIDRGRTEVRTLADMREEIEEALRQAFLPQQYGYLLAKQRPRYFPTNRGHLYQFMPGDADIMRVGNLSITLDEFRRMYPEFAPRNDVFNRWPVIYTINVLIDGEVVTREIEKLQLHLDPFYKKALEIAQHIHNATDWVKTRRATLTVSDEEALEYLPTWMEESQPGLSKTIWRLQIEALFLTAVLGDSERDAQRILMENYLTSVLTEATDQIADRAEVAGPMIFTNPQQVLDNINMPGDDRFRINFTRLGTLNRRQAATAITEPWDNLSLGRFTAPRLRSASTLASYYVSEEVNVTGIDPGDYIGDARDALIEKQAVQPLLDYYASRQQAHEIVFHKALTP